MTSCVVNSGHKQSQKSFVKKGVPIYLCPDCGCLMADITFEKDQYESASYYTMSRKTKKDIENEWGFRWRYILNMIARTGEFSSLLDVGAGNGYFVYLAATKYFLNAKGLEISKEEIQFARDVLGVQLLNEDMAQHSMVYDVVTCFNVLEHVPDPQLFLSSLVKQVKPGGILAITTPNPGCIQAKLRGRKNWRMIDPPHHINLFTKNALNELLAQQNMEVSKYETLSTYINLVRKIDTKNLILRRLFFHALRMFDLGADHFLIARRAST